MILSSYGRIVAERWQLQKNFFNVHLDYWTLMPNHLHGIIWILQPKDERYPEGEVNKNRKGTKSRSLSAIMQNFKSVSTREINQQRGKTGVKIWQSNFHERVIRNDRELNAIRDYIQYNPLRWPLDMDNISNLNR